MGARPRRSGSEPHVPELNRKGTPVTTKQRLLALLAALLTLPMTLLAAAPAQADSFRYWSYWNEEAGTWVAAETGPADVVPADGAVIGWRFLVSGEDPASNRAPRWLGDASEACGSEAAAAGEKQVAVVIDTGTAADAPAGETPPSPEVLCAAVPEAANALQATQAVADTRLDDGFVCAISGFPATGCGETVTDVTAAATENPDVDFVIAGQDTQAESASSSTPLILGAVAVLVVIIAVVAVVVARRRTP